ncbi:MAG TPA: DCC1-like thiol-disulfide oxidoreductase family protein [Rhabdochlamydiaceae bacterium]|nr:DCC1-like thiol-disulfide oxidoreductase family protein [Rhabdochlamydiaceae bacterium]
MSAHLIFFDHNCSLCQRSVRWILRRDRKALFVFAPLAGQTAASILIRDKEYLKHENSLVLIENYQTSRPTFWLRGRAVFRILWLMGGAYRLLGWLCFFPLGVDTIYRLVARHRQALTLSIKEELTPEEKARFLP